MTVNDKFQITIRVADIPEFTLTIRRSEEEFYRAAVKEVNQLWSKWKSSKVNADTNRILAVIALKFAKQFYETLTKLQVDQAQQQVTSEEVKKVLEDFEKDMDKILLGLNE